MKRELTITIIEDEDGSFRFGMRGWQTGGYRNPTELADRIHQEIMKWAEKNKKSC